MWSILSWIYLFTTKVVCPIATIFIGIVVCGLVILAVTKESMRLNERKKER